MHWQKKGHIFSVDGSLEWNKTHAQVPVADVLADRLRIYFATRDASGKSNTSYVDVSKQNPAELIYVHDAAILEFGKPGSFDDSGVMPSCIINVGEKKYLYYIGWTTRQTVPYQNAVGLAVSEDGGKTFQKISEGPVISVNHIEPYFSGTSFVRKEADLFRMWYLSCTGWHLVNGRQEPAYNIKYAESEDGINWKQTGTIAIGLQEDEGGLVSASVIWQGGVYRMWYGRRKLADYRTNTANSYRIGYAESMDGIVWERKDDLAGIDVSAEGWDAEMISYPYIAEVDAGCYLMFYNGNGFGRTGFGYAQLIN